MSLAPADRCPLIAHVVFRFDVGGLENGLVNLVNGLPEAEFRHAIIALTEASAFRRRLKRESVGVYALGKRPGWDLAAYARLYRLLRDLKPAAVHTRNFGTLDCTLIAWLAGVRVRIHGEHGWDVHDPDGTRRKYRYVRRALSPLVRRFVAVSRDLERWLAGTVGIPARKIVHICNGVDTERFVPNALSPAEPLPQERFPDGTLVVGSVTRFEEIKDPLNLVRAFIGARRLLGARGAPLRLLMVGDGPLRAAAQAELEAAGEGASAWLPGARDDVGALLRRMHLYVLGSRREGISNTVLEAMACGLPVVATATGGNLELVAPGRTGALVPPGDPAALAAAIAAYAGDPELRARQGRAARERAEGEFSLRRMLRDYRELYRTVFTEAGVAL